MKLERKKGIILAHALNQVYEQRRSNHDRWIELAVHAALTDPDWFIEWQSESANTDEIITTLMREAIQKCEQEELK
jgi:hypothetical protein